MYKIIEYLKENKIGFISDENFKKVVISEIIDMKSIKNIIEIAEKKKVQYYICNGLVLI